MFSLPVNPKLSESQFTQFYNFCKSHKDSIYDLYFTCRMPPFVQDAMGDVIVDNPYAPVETALYIQDTLGIRVSATFNNILVRPNQENLDLFIQNFKQLYDLGIRSATIPHTHWVATGQIQKAFPELQIKNTILRNVNKASDVARLAEVGFHYINIDRDVMRDRDELEKIRTAKEKYNVKIALLANEGCLGGCPMMDEHFEFNNTRFGNTPQYFNDPISRVSCPKWEYEDPSTPLKTANMTPWREDWTEMLQFVDVFKMHGRESVPRLFETLDIVKKYDNNDSILFNTFNSYIESNQLENSPIQAWRKKIKNCKFDCWDCDFCDRLYEAKSNEHSHPLVSAVTAELVNSVNYDHKFDVEGLTSNRVQNLLYGISKHCTHYLEIGSALGATAKPVVDANVCKVTCVDNWSQDIQPESEEFSLPSNLKDTFIKNVGPNVMVCDGDMFSIDVNNIRDVDMFFYDGPHDHNSVREVIKYYNSTFKDTCVLIFDDANWKGVVEGAEEGIQQSGLQIIYSKKMLNAKESKGLWWNGLFIVVAQRETV